MSLECCHTRQSSSGAGRTSISSTADYAANPATPRPPPTAHPLIALPHLTVVMDICLSGVGIALGLPVHELAEVMAQDPEVMEFRKNIMSVGKAAVEERDKDGKESQALYAFPPEIAATSQLPRSLEEKFTRTSLLSRSGSSPPAVRNNDCRNDEDKRWVVKQFQRWRKKNLFSWISDL